MLCYHFSPAVSGGVERSARFARYLPEHGWNPLVVTTNRWEAPDGEDDGVLRVGELFRRRRLRAAGRGGAGTAAAPSCAAGARSARRAPFLRFAEKWLLVPDKHVRWTARAFLDPADLRHMVWLVLKNPMLILRAIKFLLSKSPVYEPLETEETSTGAQSAPAPAAPKAGPGPIPTAKGPGPIPSR